MADRPPTTETNQVKAAFAIWNHRIAPLFDTARQALIVEAEAAGRVVRRQVALADEAPVRKVLYLTHLGVTTLVCGAVSQPVASILAAYGFEVIDYVAGDVNQIVEAWQQGRIDDDRFAMPGRRKR